MPNICIEKLYDIHIPYPIKVTNFKPSVKIRHGACNNNLLKARMNGTLAVMNALSAAVLRMCLFVLCSKVSVPEIAYNRQTNVINK